MSFLGNIDSGGLFAPTSNDPGFNYPGGSDGLFRDGTTFVEDAWNSSLGFLSDGLNVYKDYLSIKGGAEVPATGSPDQFAERAVPVDNQGVEPTAQASRQLIPGVGNGVLLLAGAGLAVAYLTTR